METTVVLLRALRFLPTIYTTASEPEVFPHRMVIAESRQYLKSDQDGYLIKCQSLKLILTGLVKFQHFLRQSRRRHRR